MVRKAKFVIAFAGVLVLVAAVNGLASVGLVTVSQEPISPLATCDNGTQPGKNFPNSEVEPQLAVYGSQMIAMYHQDRWSNGGAHGIGVGRSDGGTIWRHSTFPANMCTTPLTNPLHVYQRNSDPWVSFGPDGTAYASVLSFDIQGNHNSVVAGRWRQSEATWQHVQEIPGSIYSTFQNSTDKNATTADPKKFGWAYTVWDTLTGPTDQPDDNPHAQAYTGPTYFSRTENGGDTWTEAKIIIDTKERQQTIGNIIVVGKDGALYCFTDLIEAPNTPFRGARSNALLAFVKSTDHGDTWTAPQVIAPFNSLGVIDPNTGQRLRVGDGLEEVAVDSTTGRIYVVWESSTQFTKNVQQSSTAWDDEILLTSSGDGGQTWNATSVVHKLPTGLPTYTPTVAVNGAGIVAVTYYDNRFLGATQTANLPTDYWVSYSTDFGKTFPVEQRITQTSFDQLTAPYARGFFLGDYEGLQPRGSGFQALFVKTNCDANSNGTFPTSTQNPNCAPANYTGRTPPSSNTNPTDVVTAFLTP